MVLAAPITLALSLAGPVSPTSTAEPAAVPVQSTCPGICLMNYDPVTCLYSDGVVRSFGNMCEAENYACEHGLLITGCVARRGLAPS
jgi:hypothetical protein